ncbi:MAG TPA: DUF2306 domain-containing protein [Vicinamibacterales bacterium]|nr:DUF2306 domain-containing protein [Vicinamibacterales bacterium]
MPTATIVRRPSTRLFAQPASLLLSLLGVLACGFFFAEATQYFTFTETSYGAYAWARRWPTLLHVSSGSVALLAGPVQLWLGLTYTRPEWHRRLGLTYVAAVLLGSFAAYYLLIYSELGLGFRSGVFGLASAWLVTTGLACFAIRRGAIDQHREWMIRSYVVTTGFIMFRVLSHTMSAFGIGVVERRGVAAWGCWAVPLLITEAVIQWRKILQPIPQRPS